MKNSQTPLYDALVEYTKKNLIHFDVPGHKKRRAPIKNDPFWLELIKHDANSTKDLDNLSNPEGPIREAEKLFAKAYHADEAFFLVNGSTFGVQAMIMASLDPLDKILLPRNIHKSVINGIILSGAIPVFIEPNVNYEYGISNGITYESVKKALKENPDIKALLLIHPTYFGVVSNIGSIIALAHKHHICVLVDEAHGAHFPFHPSFPKNSASLGADLVTLSMHKTGGSLTQSSVLLANTKLIDITRVRTTINLMQTTSASYLLMASIDLARNDLEVNGKTLYDDLIFDIEKTKQQINAIPGLKVMGKEIINHKDIYDIDPTKLVISVRDLGLTGFMVYDLLLEKYQIQVELAETFVILAIVGTGDDASTLEKLVNALQDISKNHYQSHGTVEIGIQDFFKKPLTVVRPRDAFYSPKHMIPIQQSKGEICGESIMIYPPGIPLIIPGERISEEVIRHYLFYKEQNCIIMNTSGNDDILVLGKEQEKII